MGMLLRRHHISPNTTKARDVSLEPTSKEEVVEEKKYNKSEIQLMKTADLKELAKSLGIEKAEELSGQVLKGMLIEKLGL